MNMNKNENKDKDNDKDKNKNKNRESRTIIEVTYCAAIFTCIGCVSATLRFLTLVLTSV